MTYKIYAEKIKSHLQVSKIHSIYYSVSGNLNGIPIVLIHGGPGSKSKPDQRRFYNQKKYKIIQFDQRGCGNSIPTGEISKNTTWDLVDDIEKLRVHLGIKKWIVSGGSWGSTLALLYSIKNPDKVMNLILRGVFLARKKDFEWLSTFGANQLYPDLWEDYGNYLDKNKVDPKNSAKFFNKVFTKGTKKQQIEAAKVIGNYEGNMLRLINDFEFINESDVTVDDINESKIFMHYESHLAFLEEDYILNNAKVLNKIPGIIVHGRYDVICPVLQAWDLHKIYSKAELKIIPDAGHHGNEPGITNALIEYAKNL